MDAAPAFQSLSCPSPIAIPCSSLLLSRQHESCQARKKVIMVVVKGADESVRVPTSWALEKLAHAGDVVVVLAAPPRRNPFHLASHLLGFNPKEKKMSSKKKVHDKVSRRRKEIEKSLSQSYSDSIKEGVELYLCVKKGNIEALGIGYAMMLKATHVVLGRELKMYKNHFVENLPCILIQMRRKNPPSTLQGIQSIMAESNLDDTASFCKASSPQFSAPQSSPCTFEYSDVQNQETNTELLGSEIRKQPLPTHSQEKGEGCVETYKEPIYLADTDEWKDLIYSDLSQTTNTSIDLPAGDNSLCALHVCNSPMSNLGHTLHCDASDASRTSTSSIRMLSTQCNSSGFFSSISSNNYSGAGLSYMNEQVGTNVDENLLQRKQPKNIQENVKVIFLEPRITHASRLMENLSLTSINKYSLFGQQEQQYLAANGFDIVYPVQVSVKDHTINDRSNVDTNCTSLSQPSILPHTNHTLSDENKERNDYLGLSSCSFCKQVPPDLGKRPVRFSLNDLLLATDLFAHANILGEDETGVIYNGLLKDGHHIAVKKFRQSFVQRDDNFLIEIELLCCAQHRNLVMLLGYCAEDTLLMLVYEYVCNRSLSWHLAKENNPNGLEWWARQKIAVGAARGLRYLHEESRGGCIVHGEVGADNIFLTHHFLPMVGNFGLACLQQVKTDLIEAQFDRTSGYVGAAIQDDVPWKTDVYAFGVVLLELISGQRAVDNSFKPEQDSLVDWAWPLLLDGKYHELLDPRLESSYDSFELVCMVRATILCISQHPSARPRMSQVLHILERGSGNSDDSFYIEVPFSKDLQCDQKDAPDVKSQLQVVVNHSSKPKRNSKRVTLPYDKMLS